MKNKKVVKTVLLAVVGFWLLVGAEYWLINYFSQRAGQTVTQPVLLEINQKTAYQEAYPEIDLTNLSQLTGRVTALDEKKMELQVAINHHAVWVKINPRWQGNILTKNLVSGQYFETDTIDLTKNEWYKLNNATKKATKISLICLEEKCHESISGHLYFD